MSGTQELHPYTQGVLTFVDTDGDYGADTQGVDYAYQFTPLSQSQTQVSQLTQNDPATSKGERLIISSVTYMYVCDMYIIYIIY